MRSDAFLGMLAMTMYGRVLALLAASVSLILTAIGDAQPLTTAAIWCTAGAISGHPSRRRHLLVARVSAAAGVITALAGLVLGMLPQQGFLLLALAGAALCRLFVRDTAADALALTAAGCIALALGGHALEFRPYFATNTQAMSLPTVLVLLALCLAVLLAHRGRGLVTYLRNHGTAGRMTRYLLPIPFVLPYVSSAVTQWAVQHRMADPVVIFWTFALFNTVVAALLIFASVHRLDRAERARAAAHEQLQRANAELEQRVRERTAELDETNAVLRATNAELEQFAYLSAHDLQEPLRIVRVYGQLLERRAPDLPGDVREHLHTIIAAVERMQALVRDVQRYSEALHSSPTYGDVPLNAVAHAAMQRIAGILLAARASVTVANLPVVRGSAEQLETVFVHLLTNSVKFRSDRPPQIHISATRNEECEIRVTDNGIGISPAYHERIFGLFKRLHVATQGTGLGLALCRRIITAHGGRLWVTSGLGAGATFHFTLPPAQAMQKSEEQIAKR